MKRLVILACLAALLSGCVVVPVDYGYERGGYYGHEHREHHWNRGGPYGRDRR
jgi:hypothetical protein